MQATLFVPATATEELEKIVEAYRTQNDSRSNMPKSQKLVEGIAQFRLAQLRELWTDAPEVFPRTGQDFHWETWLRDGSLDRFKAAAEQLNIALGPVPLVFPETAIVRVTATPERMAILLNAAPCIAQVRRSSVTADFFDNLPAGWPSIPPTTGPLKSRISIS